MGRQRRSCSKEFKREAVRLVDQSGSSKTDIARDLGVSRNVLAGWYREQKDGEAPAAKGADGVSPEECERMRRELDKVKTGRGILKKALGHSLQSSGEVRLHRQTWGYVAYQNNVPGSWRVLQRPVPGLSGPELARPGEQALAQGDPPEPSG